MITLGIETSCDETSVAILNNTEIAANRIFTQEIHSEFGGVVPEMASRAHLSKIEPLSNAVLADAGMGIDDIDLVAVTDRPGLAGALLVGIGFALGIQSGHKKIVTGINHLEGHICSVLLEHPHLSFPFLALVVSGGHTAIYHVKHFGDYECLGQTVDDAAGEAFDKVGKLLGFPYPAGRAIEQEAARAADTGGLTFPIARVSPPGINFSFSGLKTAVRYHLEKSGFAGDPEQRSVVCKAFQTAVIESLRNGLLTASEETGIRNVALVGGVACNGALRVALKESLGETVFYPSPRLCTDNAAMIALAGYFRFNKNMLRPPRLQPGGGLK